MDPKQELASSITTHVMRILSIQEQMRECDKNIADLEDQQSRAEQERRELENKMNELNEVLQYSLMNSSDPTQALLTMSRKDVQKALENSKKPNKTAEEHLKYLQAFLDPDKYPTQADWLDGITIRKWG